MRAIKLICCCTNKLADLSKLLLALSNTEFGLWEDSGLYSAANVFLGTEISQKTTKKLKNMCLMLKTQIEWEYEKSKIDIKFRKTNDHRQLSVYKRRQEAEGRRQEETIMNENLLCGYKTQFKKNNCIERKVQRDTKRPCFNPTISKRGLLLPPASCLLSFDSNFSQASPGCYQC
jgi:hypothetical protein